MLSYYFLEVLDKNRSLFSLYQIARYKIVMRDLLLIIAFTRALRLECREPFLVLRVIGPQTNRHSSLNPEQLQEHLIYEVHISDVTHVL